MVSKFQIIKSGKMEGSESNSNSNSKVRTSYQFNHKILLISLVTMAFIITTYFWADEREEFSKSSWIIILVIWYAGIIVCLCLVFKKRRIGYALSGLLGWITIAFWLSDNFHLVFDISLFLPEPNVQMIIRNFVGILFSSILVFSSHNAFHKITTRSAF
tara:strand:+ start:127 stop:603 length:477 start_codon:yes stop_codon:yes gene_type:complete